MSAYVVSNKHIDTILQFTTNYHPLGSIRVYHKGDVLVVDTPALTKVGRILLDENEKSYAYRYNEDTPAPSQYVFKRAEAITSVEAIKLCDCLIYQSCETGAEYYDSLAYEIVTAIRERAIDTLPGYEQAAWSI